jgi:cysteine/O-acetylserine efflux protein
LSVAATAALFGTGWYALVAVALSRPVARALALRRHRLICRAAAACLTFLAVRSVLSAFSFA